MDLPRTLGERPVAFFYASYIRSFAQFIIYWGKMQKLIVTSALRGRDGNSAGHDLKKLLGKIIHFRNYASAFSTETWNLAD